CRLRAVRKVGIFGSRSTKVVLPGPARGRSDLEVFFSTRRLNLQLKPPGSCVNVRLKNTQEVLPDGRLRSRTASCQPRRVSSAGPGTHPVFSTARFPYRETISFRRRKA